MKKIVGTILATSLALTAFAAEPAVNHVMSEFTGSAGFGFKADFADPDDAKMGMFNDASASIKFGFATEGDKATTGDGIWGDLAIKFEKPWEWSTNNKGEINWVGDMKAPVVDRAKIHLVNGDFSAALNILKPSIKYDAFGVATATPVASLSKNNAPGKDVFKTLRDAAEGVFNTKQTAYNTAKEAFDKATDENRLEKWNDLQTAKSELDAAKAEFAKYPAATAATKSSLGAFGLAELGSEAGLEKGAGFGLEMKLENLFALNFKLMDNGVSTLKDNGKKMGMAIDASLLAVPNLTANVASSFNFDTGYIGVRANADYTIGITDALYVKPAVGYQMVKANKDTKDLSNALVAGVLFGWGAKDTENELDFFGKVKFNEGVSFAITPMFKKYAEGTSGTEMLMSIGLYDQSLFNLLGLSDFGTLKTAFGYDMYMSSLTANSKTVTDTYSTITVALAYDKDFTSAYVNLHGGLQAKLYGSSENIPAEFKKAQESTSYKFGVKLGTKALIDNTDLYVGYELAGTVDVKKAEKNELVIGTAINF